jgi:hypothetical protein
MNVTVSVSRYETCKLWMDGLRSKHTKTSYTIHLSLFCRFHHTNPDELVKLKPEQLKEMVIEYVLDLKTSSGMERVRILRASQNGVRRLSIV